ncbi:MAG: NAD(P)H-hydrate dehydratase [Saccharofermentans sp.]|nr:NAD(P)H-hydrate dehydratase [Saccharofermentans sp.]
MSETKIPDRFEFLSGRDDNGHKNTFGTATIIAGSEYMTGAAVLAADSALRSGCGLVRVFSDEKTLDAVRYNLPCALLMPRDGSETETVRQMFAVAETKGAVLIGPGMPPDDPYLKIILAFALENIDNLVLDAGALTLMAKDKTYYYGLLKARKNPAILTPHVGEFARLSGLDMGSLGEEETAKAVSEFAISNKCIVIFKNSNPRVATFEGSNYYSGGDFANSGLAKGGAGDVLAGLVTGLLAQFADKPAEVSAAAVRIHSLAGKLAADEYGEYPMIPSDIADFFPEAFRQVMS